MEVHREEAVSVIEDDGVARVEELFRQDHRPVRDRHNRRALVERVVGAHVSFPSK